MQRRNLFAAAALGLALTMPIGAADKDKDKPDPKDKAAEKMVTTGQVTGSLKVDGGSQKYITVTVNLSYVVPNAQGALQAMQRQQQLLQYQREVMAARSPQQRQQALIQLYRALAQGQNAVHVQQMNKDLDFQAADDMKVRIMYPPPAFDEKGNLKKYTAKELRELKGNDSTLPGYAAEMDALKSGQIVTVYLAKQQPKKKKDKDDLEDDKPSIRMIVIQAEPKEKG
jgi:hypothetical protein